ncbi:MAG: ABC transporter substrate-binding protein [Colwelliaceae bacterium]|nr:ABC transporter substrate-binding protein [Colwelliaceae bacterium]
MRYAFLIFIFIFPAFQVLALQCTEKKPDILFIVPNANSVFWKNKTLLMQKSALELGINLTVYNAPLSAQNRYAYTKQINKYLSSHQHPDFIISYLWLKTEENFIAMLDNFKIPFISINSNIDKHNEFFGNPREKYQYWLAHISPDDFDTGYQLAKKLIEQYKVNHTASPNILALGGRRDSSSSQARKLGLDAYLKQHKKVNFLQYISTNWTSNDATLKMNALLNRHPKIDIVWAANDSIATGVSDALVSKVRSTQPIIGGVDWLPKVLPKIKTKKISLSLGGHMFDGVWAQVLLYDYFNGVDFISDTGGIIKTNMVEISPKNIEKMSKKLTPKNFHHFKIKQLSKCFNPTLNKYDINVEKMFSFSS